MEEKPPRVRFAPSPTGPFHLGSARTALFNWLFARKNGGVFVLRIEDTDKERSEKEFETQILDSLSWLGIVWDEGPDSGGDYGPYRQSERIELYKKYLEKLLADGKAYYCYCTPEELAEQRNAMEAEGLPPKYGGHCRNLKSPPPGKLPQVIRFKMPEVEVEFKDIIRGTVKFDSSLFGDIVIAKDLETPLYNFAVTVDDHLMEITHVIRGEDHISNTPKQILLARAMEFMEPHFAHLPLILSKDRSKLSKRYAETSLLSYREQGFLPEALDNFLALLGWHPSDDRELFLLPELVSEFELKRVQKSGAIWNQEKLLWLNGEHLKKLPAARIAELLTPLFPDKNLDRNPQFLEKVVEVARDRMKTLKDFWDYAAFFFELDDYAPSLLVWQSDTPQKTQEILSAARKALSSVQEPLSRENVLAAIEDLISDSGRGSVLWPLRVAVSGRAASPDPLDIIPVLGKEESLDRIDAALKKLK
jgi:glutamyl-tRNA synthetase